MNDHCDRSQIKRAYRQPTWGRAATVPVTDLNGEAPQPGQEGMVDIKGVGHAPSEMQLHKVDAFPLEKQVEKWNEISRSWNPFAKKIQRLKFLGHNHAHGLMECEAAFREMMFTEAMQQGMIARNQELNLSPQDALQTIESYFILVHPVRVRVGINSHFSPACMLGRQAHVGRSFSYGGTKGIYEDYHGRRQADLFSAATDMGAVYFTDPKIAKELSYNIYSDDKIPTRVMNQFYSGDRYALYKEYNRVLSNIVYPSVTGFKDEFGHPIDVRAHYDFKNALRFAFGRGPAVDPAESSRPRYNKNKNPDETYHLECQKFKGEMLDIYWNKYCEGKQSEKPEFYDHETRSSQDAPDGMVENLDESHLTPLAEDPSFWAAATAEEPKLHKRFTWGWWRSIWPRIKSRFSRTTRAQ